MKSKIRNPKSEIRKRGFSLIELLVVMMIIAILMGIVVYTFTAVMRSKAEQTMKLRLKEVQSAMRGYYDMWKYPPFDVTPANYDVQQNGAMVDNMSNPDSWWVQRRGDLLGKNNPEYRFDRSVTPMELLDVWGVALVLKVVDPAASPQPPEHLIAEVGRYKVVFYSLGYNANDEGGTGVDNDDIGPGGSKD